jgi:nicotinamide mononucleotide adenylyltransferase
MSAETDGKTIVQQDTLPEKGQSSVDEKSGTSKVAKTFTEEQARKMVSEALAEQGRKHGETLKSYQERLAAIEAEKEAQQLEEIKDKPEQVSIFQERKKAREEREWLKAEQTKLAEERERLNQELTEAQQLKREKLVNTIVQEYDGLEASKLFTLVELAKANTKEEIITIADAIGTKKSTNPENKNKINIVPDSGETAGGGRNLSIIKFGKDAPSASEMIAFGLKKKK